jgi:lipoyl(octanoyl) transferase
MARRMLTRTLSTALPPLNRHVRWHDSGTVEYAKAWDWQQQLSKKRWGPDPDAFADLVIALEHPHVFTLGRGATEADLRFDPSASPRIAAIHRVERGGQVTYHGPGQLVVYPLLQLGHFKKDLRWYVTAIEQVIIDALGTFKLAAGRAQGYPGVWIDDRKIAQVGISCSKWVTAHGFAINVSPDLSYFDRIVPCGITDKRVTSVQLEYERRGIGALCPTVANVHTAVQAAFAENFGAQLQRVVGECPLEADSLR